MLRRDCRPTFKRPRIVQPSFEATKKEKDHAEKMAAEIARIVALAADENAEAPDPCSLGGLAQRQLKEMSGKGRRVAIRAAQNLAARPPRDRVRSDDIDPKLRRLTRVFARQRLEALRP